MHKVSQLQEVPADIRMIFNAPDRIEAERLLERAVTKWAEPAPALAEWMAEILVEDLTVFEYQAKLRRRLRTSNMLERLSRELKRRTLVATLFPNEASLQRLAAPVFAGVSEEWETGRVYLDMGAE